MKRFILFGKMAEILAQLRLMAKLETKTETITCPHCSCEFEREVGL